MREPDDNPGDVSPGGGGWPAVSGPGPARPREDGWALVLPGLTGAAVLGKSGRPGTQGTSGSSPTPGRPPGRVVAVRSAEVPRQARQKRALLGRTHAVITVAGVVLVLLAAGGYLVWRETSGGLPTSVPSCSWPLRVRGPATGEQAGLIRCYLRALAGHDAAGFLAVADTAARTLSDKRARRAAPGSGATVALTLSN